MDIAPPDGLTQLQHLRKTVDFSVGEITNFLNCAKPVGEDSLQLRIALDAYDRAVAAVEALKDRTFEG